MNSRTVFFRFCVVFLLIVLATPGIKAQNYNNAVGLRLGYPFGISAKFGLSGPNYMEAIVAGYGNGFTLTGLWEHHWYPAKREEFSVYAGGGAHIGTFNDRGGPYFDRGDGPDVALGIDGILGLEWTFRNAPINLSFDYKPAFSLIDPIGYWYGDAALSIRYAW